MSLTLQQIMDQADALMENPFTTTKKVDWLNQINQEFFEIVKVPLATTLALIAAQTDYVMTSAVRARNIRSVMNGFTSYMSVQYGDGATAGRNTWSYNDTTNTLSLSPAPAASGSGVIRYFARAATNFVPATLTATPDAPEEYHWLYVSGLAEKIAKASDDVAKANNFSTEYQSGLMIAQQNYQAKG